MTRTLRPGSPGVRETRRDREPRERDQAEVGEPSQPESPAPQGDSDDSPFPRAGKGAGNPSQPGFAMKNSRIKDKSLFERCPADAAFVLS